jgi:hypothetical protein
MKRTIYSGKVDLIMKAREAMFSAVQIYNHHGRVNYCKQQNVLPSTLPSPVKGEGG